MCKIKGKVEGCIDVKRFYLPGIEIETQCTKCSEIKNWKGRNEIQLDIMVKIDSP